MSRDESSLSFGGVREEGERTFYAEPIERVGILVSIDPTSGVVWCVCVVMPLTPRGAHRWEQSASTIQEHRCAHRLVLVHRTGVRKHLPFQLPVTQSGDMKEWVVAGLTVRARIAASTREEGPRRRTGDWSAVIARSGQGNMRRKPPSSLSRSLRSCRTCMRPAEDERKANPKRKNSRWDRCISTCWRRTASGGGAEVSRRVGRRHFHVKGALSPPQSGPGEEGSRLPRKRRPGKGALDCT